uniref:Uncharacterized protein n=1 Tax=Avena sativa TaxID=4498 RepID=A0ACD5Z8M8_AVESA
MDQILHSTPVFYSVPEITNPWKSTDEELVRFFMERGLKISNSTDRLEDLSRRRPEKLPSVFLTDGVFSPSEGWQTDQGRWVPKKVSSVGNSMLGVKTTLEFKPNNGSIKVDVGQMVIYSGLFTHLDGLFFDEGLSLCCVFPKGKGPSPAPDPCNGFVPPPLGEWKEDLRTNFDATDFCPLGVEDYGVVGGPKKRHRGGGRGWEGYTKIYTKDPDRMYAACNHCTTMLKIKPGSGTGSQSHHNKSCRFKNLPTTEMSDLTSTPLV